MGVMPCSRKSCVNILCDRYSPRYGYICNNCFEELIVLKQKNKDIDIDDFLNSATTTEDTDFGITRALLEEEFEIT